MQTQTEPEQIEGLEDDSDIDLGHYPVDTFLIRNESQTVYDAVRRISQGKYIMDPDFQRDFIWDTTKQSKLIESVLMRIPLPAIYLAENKDGKSVVVDGLQRLSTFYRFVENDLRLNLPNRPDLHGKIFRDLTPRLQNRIDDCILIIFLIDNRTDHRALLDIFGRVNSGEPLTRQQVRNYLFSGDGTKFLREESKTEIFRKATGTSLGIGKMRDREFVNRFCAFQILDIEDYKDMDDFLAEALRRMNTDIPLSHLSQQFRISLQNNLFLFGNNAFRKHTPEQENRGILNASLWDVMSTGLSRYSKRLVMQKSQVLKRRYYDLLETERFNDSITRSTNSVKQVRYRFSATRQMLQDVLGTY